MIDRRRSTLGPTAAVLAWACLMGMDHVATADPSDDFTRYAGRHLTLLTDLPASTELADLVELFDAAVPGWCAYFDVTDNEAADWRATACLMTARERFKQSGLLPDDVPEFGHGYARADKLWLDAQSSDYYQRHLLLHEGTHAFVLSHLKAGGPPWYGEGLAELLATHRWRSGQLQLDIFPRSRDEVPGWGRIELVQRARDTGTRLTLDEVIAFDDRAHRQVDAYAWSWAAVTLLHRLPDTAEVFDRLPTQLRRRDFNKQAVAALRKANPHLDEQWGMFIDELCYGYDFSRMAIDWTPATDEPAGSEERAVTVRVDHGWQNSGLRLRGGDRYRLSAQGRFVIAHTDRPWPCEPGGVTIRYHSGRPLGMLLAAVRPDEPGANATGACWRQPAVVGLGAELVPETDGTLYFRVNDSPAELSDNKGQIDVRLRAR